MGITTKLPIDRAVHDVISSATIHEPITVFIISDVRLTREGLALLLAQEPSVSVVGAASSSVTVNHIAELHPDIGLLDAALADIRDCARRLSAIVHGIKFVAFALSEADHELIACAEAGVSAFIGRDESPQDLLRAIHQVRRGEFSISPQRARLLLGRIAELAQSRAWPPDNLTPREREIVPLIERGFSNKEIARQLSIETATIKNHVHNILEKMQLRSRGEVAARVRASQAGPGA